MLQEQETERKAFLLLLSACNVDSVDKWGLPAYGAQQEVASWKAEHEAKLGSQQHSMADYWLLHTYTTVQLSGKISLWKSDTYFSKHCLVGRKIMQSQARNLFTEEEAQSFKVSPPP